MSFNSLTPFIVFFLTVHCLIAQRRPPCNNVLGPCPPSTTEPSPPDFFVLAGRVLIEKSGSLDYNTFGDTERNLEIYTKAHNLRGGGEYGIEPDATGRFFDIVHLFKEITFDVGPEYYNPIAKINQKSDAYKNFTFYLRPLRAHNVTYLLDIGPEKDSKETISCAGPLRFQEPVKEIDK